MSSTFFDDLLTNILAELIGLGLGILATYFIVEKALESRRLSRAKPVAKSALEYRLWPVQRVVMFVLYPLLGMTDQEIKDKLPDLQENHFVLAFEIMERLIDAYAHLIPEDIQTELMDFGQQIGFFADLIFHLKANYEIIDDLDEWKDFRPRCKDLMAKFETLLDKLAKRELISDDFIRRLKEFKGLPDRSEARRR